MNEPWWSAEAKRRFELQSYEPPPTIDGVEFVELTRHADDGGSRERRSRPARGAPRAQGGRGWAADRHQVHVAAPSRALQRGRLAGLPGATRQSAQNGTRLGPQGDRHR